MDEIPNICYQPGKIMLDFRTIALFSLRARLNAISVASITAPDEESGATAAACCRKLLMRPAFSHSGPD
jgi:hypothetical protein